MRTTRLRPLALVAAAAVLLGPLAGCGSDDTKDAAAKSTPSASSTASPSASSSTSATGTPTPDAASTEGAAGPGERLTKDNLVPTMLAAMRDKKTAHVTMEFGSSLGADADVKYGGEGTDMKMTMSMGAQDVVAILVDGVIYMQQTAGGKFVKVDENTPGMGEMLKQVSGLGPEGAIAAWKGAVEDVQRVGTASVDGTKVEEYRVTLDTAALPGTLAGLGGSAALPKTVTYKLYVDQDHLMRRIDMTVSKQHITMTVSRWGEPVDIKAPPASQLASQ